LMLTVAIFCRRRMTVLILGEARTGTEPCINARGHCRRARLRRDSYGRGPGVKCSMRAIRRR
jgi:hypothetical protein